MVKVKGKYKDIITYLFYGLFGSYIILLLIEQLFGFVSLYLNLNLLLMVLIIVGVFYYPLQIREDREKEKRLNKYDNVFIWVIGILGCLLIYINVRELGWISYIITFSSLILIILSSYLLCLKKNKKTEKSFFNRRKKIKKFVLPGLLCLFMFILIIIYPISSLQFFKFLLKIAYLFLPGYLLSLIFFDIKKVEISIIERISLSFGLVIVFIPLIVFYLTLIGIKISILNFVFIIFIIDLLLFIVYKRKKTLIKKRSFYNESN